MVSRGTVESGSVEVTVTVSLAPRSAAVREATIRKAWATTPNVFVSARPPAPAVTRRTYGPCGAKTPESVRPSHASATAPAARFVRIVRTTRPLVSITSSWTVAEAASMNDTVVVGA
jgi:hypothetical protein